MSPGGVIKGPAQSPQNQPWALALSPGRPPLLQGPAQHLFPWVALAGPVWGQHDFCPQCSTESPGAAGVVCGPPGGGLPPALLHSELHATCAYLKMKCFA